MVTVNLPILFLVCAVFVALATFIFGWRLISALLLFRKDLIKHQEDDCARLDALHGEVCALTGEVSSLRTMLTDFLQGKYPRTRNKKQ